MGKPSQNIVTPQFLGKERYVVLEENGHYSYIDVDTFEGKFIAANQSGVLGSIMNSGCDKGEEKEVLQAAMNSIINWWNFYNPDYVEKLAYPIKLARIEKQLELF